jgi:ribulose-phosphate 3-epimerase
MGCKAGIALNPATPVHVLDHLLGDIDLVLVMSVNPGFGGQKFIASQCDKIREIRRRIDASGREIDLEVDGGVNDETAPEVIAAGADLLVAGTAAFKGGPAAYADNIRRLRGRN